MTIQQATAQRNPGLVPGCGPEPIPGSDPGQICALNSFKDLSSVVAQDHEQMQVFGDGIHLPLKLPKLRKHY